MASVVAAGLTANEFYDFVNLPSNRGRNFELERGEVVEMPPPGKLHGFVCGNVARLLGNYASLRGRGYICTNDSGVILERAPDTVRGIDVCFYDDAQTADDMERRYAEVPPIMAVEVMSPSDRINPMMQRVSQMLGSGVKMVWIVDPEARDVSVCRAERPAEVLCEDDELAVSDVLPGFRCRVAELFLLPASPGQAGRLNG